MFRIVPKIGLKIINPDTMKKVSEDGVIVQKITTFWTNRLKDGDITIEDLKKTKKVISKKEEK